MVSVIHSVNKQGMREHLQPYHNELESVEKESTRSRPWSESNSRSPVQRSGSQHQECKWSCNLRGCAADGKGLEHDSNTR
jgi:hypothetical protein